MKQLSSFMVLDVNGGTRISYTYDEIDETTGKQTSKNNKDGFYVMDDNVKSAIETIRNYIRTVQM